MVYLRFLIPLISKVNCQEDWKKTCILVNPSIFKIICPRTNAYCGGFFINSHGIGISAYHFYEEIGKKTNECKLIYNNKEYNFDVIAISQETHIIVIKSPDLKNTPYLKFTEKIPRLGSEAAVFSMNPSAVQIFEPGYILDLEYEKVHEVNFKCIHSSCRGGPGYSGGPIVNREGLVLGMQKSSSNLFSIYDSIAIPSQHITNYLKKIARKDGSEWNFD